MTTTDKRVQAALARVSSALDIPNPDECLVRQLVEADFRSGTLVRAYRIHALLEERHPATVRHCMYALMPDTTSKSYRSVQGPLLRLRRAGIVPWEWVVDEGRSFAEPWGLADREAAAQFMAWTFKSQPWDDQTARVVCVVEKNAMRQVCAPVLSALRIPVLYSVGDSSDTAIIDMAKAMETWLQPVEVLVLSDHDVNGLNIPVPMERKLAEHTDTAVTWHRVGVLEEDMTRFASNIIPVKLTGDNMNNEGWKTRCERYIDIYGDRCLELDAIDPRIIRARLRAAILKHWEWAEWLKSMRYERDEQAFWQDFVDRGCE